MLHYVHNLFIDGEIITFPPPTSTYKDLELPTPVLNGFETFGECSCFMQLDVWTVHTVFHLSWQLLTSNSVELLAAFGGSRAVENIKFWRFAHNPMYIMGFSLKIYKVVCAH